MKTGHKSELAKGHEKALKKGLKIVIAHMLLIVLVAGLALMGFNFFEENIMALLKLIVISICLIAAYAAYFKGITIQINAGIGASQGALVYTDSKFVRKYIALVYLVIALIAAASFFF